MTYNDFYEKLNPFFTDEQIDNLDDYAYESACDAHEYMYMSDDSLYNIGRDFVCMLLADMTGDSDPIESIENISGGTLSAENYEALVNQMDEEW